MLSGSSGYPTGHLEMKFRVLPIAAYLAVFALTLSLPVIAFAVALLLQLQDADKFQFEQRILSDSQSIARSAGRRLQDMKTTADLLATFPELVSGDFKSFHERAQAGLRLGSSFVLLVDREGQQLLNTRVPFGTSLGKTSDMGTLSKALAAQQTQVSDVFYGTTGKRWVFNVILPLPEDVAKASGAGAIIVTQNADELTRLVNASGLQPGWKAALIDAENRVIASSGDVTVGELLPLPRSGATGIEYFTDTSGAEVMMGKEHVPDASWQVAIWGPRSTTFAATWGYLLAGGVALLALSTLIAWFGAGRINNAIVGLSKMARQLGHGEIVPPIQTDLLELNQVSAVLADASSERSQSDTQMRLVLGELIHRTKNLLTVVQSLINQTARHSETVEELQQALTGRVAGLGKSIDLLVATEWEKVSLPSILKSHLTAFSDTGFEIDGPTIYVSPEAVQNLGLILHEMATNAVKYGALSVPEGRVKVSWTITKNDEPRFQLDWQERNGPPVTPPTRKGFGSAITQRHGEAAFRANVTAEYKPTGLEWRMDAPLSAIEAKDGKSS